MRLHLTRLISLVALTCALPALSAAALAADDVCTTSTLPIDGTEVTATFCTAPARVAVGGTATVTETFRAGEKSVNSSIDIPVAASDGVSRGIDDIKLDPLGLKRSLHVTVAYRAGRATLEHALLLPGAIPLK